MKRSFRHRDGRWREARCLPAGEIPREVACWLLDRGSLTRRLQQACSGRFSVKLLGQAWQRPLHEEARLLGLDPQQWVLTRQVLLMCDGVPWVYARTVMPRHTLVGRLRRLADLGTRPLGATLFADPSMRRGPVQVAQLAPGQGLHRLVVEAAAECAGQPVWGRRSVFRLSDKPLLVYELFLPRVGRCRG
jgi:chorismate--pyruvate lyase